MKTRIRIEESMDHDPDSYPCCHCHLSPWTWKGVQSSILKEIAFSIKDSDKDSYADLVTDSAKDLRIPARFRKRNSLITEFMEMLRLHLERKLEVCSRGLKEEERVKYGNLEARVVKILPTFFVRIKFIDGSTSEVNPNTITSARA